MFVSCECCMLSGRGLCDGSITRPEESYRMWRVCACVCGRLNVTKYNGSHLHLEWVEREKKRKLCIEISEGRKEETL
jgi:hypothetical protein